MRTTQCGANERHRVSFEIVHKPTFTNQLLAIPRERIVQVLEKVERLREDPRPHGDLKKKLHGYRGNVYRLRSGDYRVLYSYGDGWVTLLGVDSRKDVYKGERLVAEEPQVLVTGLPDAGDLLETSNGRSERSSVGAPVTAAGEELPFGIDEELLGRLRVPRKHHTALVACQTLDDLLVAHVPEPVRGRVFDAVYLRQRAAQIVRSGAWTERFDGVLVDEAQDLDPTVLRLLVSVCRTPNRLFVAADANQSIYGSGFRWSDVHEDLRFTGRTGVLRRNHRSTREIGEAAHSYLREGGLEDPGEGQDYAEIGPKPAVRVVEDRRDEAALLARFLIGAAKEFRLGVGACAVLVPSQGAGKKLAVGLASAGLEAAYMSGRDLDLGRGGVKILNLKSAKGLEFPIVAIAGLSHGRMPGVPKDASGGELEEALLRERRTLYVAMTRAMRALLVVLPANPANGAAPLLEGFDDDHWNIRSGVLA